MLTVIEILRIVIGGFCLLNGSGRPGDLFVTVARQHQVVLRLCDGDACFCLHQRVLKRGFVQHSQRLPGFDGIAFVNVQRGQPSADAEAHVHGADIHVAVQRQATILLALIPQPATDSRSK